MITYRDGKPGDGAMLGGIARATFIETFGLLYSLPNLEGFLRDGTDAAYEAELNDPDIEVRFAMAHDVPIGFCKVSRLKLPADTSEPTAMELRQLYIFRPWQGAGIAQVLTQWALERARARGAKEIWLSVFTENHRARRFYARHGFVEIAPYEFMVGDQADEDVLCRAVL
jgi:ribosomal protein S18 acetylase RimI-like enzyme